jgi:hypothetical protein
MNWLDLLKQVLAHIKAFLHIRRVLGWYIQIFLRSFFGQGIFKVGLKTASHSQKFASLPLPELVTFIINHLLNLWCHSSPTLINLLMGFSITEQFCNVKYHQCNKDLIMPVCILSLKHDDAMMVPLCVYIKESGRLLQLKRRKSQVPWTNLDTSAD